MLIFAIRHKPTGRFVGTASYGGSLMLAGAYWYNSMLTAEQRFETIADDIRRGCGGPAGNRDRIEAYEIVAFDAVERTAVKP